MSNPSQQQATGKGSVPANSMQRSTQRSGASKADTLPETWKGALSIAPIAKRGTWGGFSTEHAVDRQPDTQGEKETATGAVPGSTSISVPTGKKRLQYEPKRSKKTAEGKVQSEKHEQQRLFLQSQAKSTASGGEGSGLTKSQTW